MNFNTKFKICLWKSYWEKGNGISAVIKPFVYGAVGFAAFSQNIFWTLILGSAYALICILVGWWWYNYGMIFAEAEVGNRFNFFQREVRTFLKKKSLNRKKL